jgi:hypothetical protein
MVRRREFLAAGAVTLAGLNALSARESRQAPDKGSRGSIPLIHITDLYHPPQDPDDHFDLATIAALEEYDLKAVILDVTERFLNPPPDASDVRREPGFIPATQMASLLGRHIPVATGPREQLASPQDDVMGRPSPEQAGVNLLLETLRLSDSRVFVSSVGSCRVLAAACNRDQGLLRSKVQSVLLVAGSSGGSKIEWNVSLDPEAYKTLWHSGLPIHWFPCATERSPFDADHERSTYWKAPHEALLRDIPGSLQAWFAYALAGSDRSDFIRALGEKPSGNNWEDILLQERNLWSTVPLVMGAGRVLAKTTEGWRFVAATKAQESEVWPWRLDPIETTVDEDARVHWRQVSHAGNALLFGRDRKTGFGSAMVEALNALLKSLSL